MINMSLPITQLKIKLIPLSSGKNFRLKPARKVTTKEYSVRIKSEKVRPLWSNDLRGYLNSRPLEKIKGSRIETASEAIGDYLAHAKLRRTEAARKRAQKTPKR